MPLVKKDVATPSPVIAHAMLADMDVSEAVARLRTDPSATQRQRILTTLVRSADANAARELAQLLDHAPITLRNEVMDALRDMSGQVLPVAAQLLRSSDVNLRIYAISILDENTDAATADLMALQLQRDDEENVCAAAAELLGRIGEQRHVSALREVAQRFSGRPFLQLAVSQALRNISGQE
ncbi:hypothetical protein JCM19000A_22380 [Silvimonas sp. JCM 19000]